jgi:sugar phosphate isomerase/epimerase
MSTIGLIHYRVPGAFEDFLRFARTVGFESAEIMLPDVAGPTGDAPAANARAVRAMMDDHGVVPSALSAHNDFVQLDPTAIDRQVEHMRRVMAYATEAGIRVLRTEGGAPKAEVPEARWQEAITRCLEKVLPLAADAQIDLAIDNHGVITNNGDLLLGVLRHFQHPRLGSNLDTMNFRWAGNDLDTIKRFYRELAPYVKHTHFKDGFGSRASYVCMPLGEGELDLPYAIQCLRQAGYDGAFTAEYEGKEEASVGYGRSYAWLTRHVRPKR